MKIECEIWEAKDGKLTAIKIDNAIFVPEEFEADELEQQVSSDTESDIIGMSGKIHIRKSVIQELMTKLRESSIMDTVLKERHSNVQASTIKRYKYAYINYILSKVISTPITVNADASTPKESRDVDRETELEAWLKIPAKKKRKKRHQKPEGAIGYSKTYGLWIKQEDYNLVIRALRKWNFKATVNNIVEETRLPKSRVRATLEYMVNKGDAYYSTETRSVGGKVRVYYPADGKAIKIDFP